MANQWRSAPTTSEADYRGKTSNATYIKKLEILLSHHSGGTAVN